MEIINKIYGEALLNNILNDKVTFFLNKDNVGFFCTSVEYIKKYYNYGFNINSDDLTISWIKIVENVINGKKFYH